MRDKGDQPVDVGDIMRRTILVAARHFMTVWRQAFAAPRSAGLIRYRQRAFPGMSGIFFVHENRGHLRRVLTSPVL